MIGPVKIIAAVAMLVTVQNTGRSPPAADQLQEATNDLNARLGTRVSLELNGCMKDDRNSTAVTCYYKFAKAITFEVHADAPKGPVKRVAAEYLGGKDNAHYMAILAEFLADLLVPNAPARAAVDLQRKIEADFAGAFGGGSANLGPYDFDYRSSEKTTTLKIFSR